MHARAHAHSHAHKLSLRACTHTHASAVRRVPLQYFDGSLHADDDDPARPTLEIPRKSPARDAARDHARTRTGAGADGALQRTAPRLARSGREASDLVLGAARLQSTLPARSELPARIQPYLDSRPSGAAAAAAVPDYDGAAAPFVHVYEDAGTAAPLVLGRAPGSRVVYDSDGITVTTSS